MDTTIGHFFMNRVHKRLSFVKYVRYNDRQGVVNNHRGGKHMPKQISNVSKKIMDAALKIYREEGYESISMRKIAKVSGLAVGTVYNRFENKEDLLAQLLAGDIEKIKHRMMETVFGKEPEEALRALVCAFVENTMHESRSIIQNMLDKQSRRAFVDNILFGASNQIKQVMEELLCRVYCKYNVPLAEEESSLLAEMALSMLQTAAHAEAGASAMRANMVTKLLLPFDIVGSELETAQPAMAVL